VLTWVSFAKTEPTTKAETNPRKRNPTTLKRAETKAKVCGPCMEATNARKKKKRHTGNGSNTSFSHRWQQNGELIAIYDDPAMGLITDDSRQDSGFDLI
jgi:hypothetical protein